MRWAVKRYWELCDSVEVEADSAQGAITVAHAMRVPYEQAEFVPDSLNSELSTDVQQIPVSARGIKVVIIDLYGDGDSLRVCEDRVGIDEILAEYMEAETDEHFDEFMERKGVPLLIDRRVSLSHLQCKPSASHNAERRRHGRSL